MLRIRMLRLTATMLSLGKLIFSNLQESAKPVGITGTGQGKNQMPLWAIRYNQKKSYANWRSLPFQKVSILLVLQRVTKERIKCHFELPDIVRKLCKLILFTHWDWVRLVGMAKYDQSKNDMPFWITVINRERGDWSSSSFINVYSIVSSIVIIIQLD